MKRANLVFQLHRETYIPKRIREAVPASGPADAAIAWLRQHCTIEVSLQDVQAYLKSTGGWTLDELQDLDKCIDRLLWLACLETQEQNDCYFYMGE